MSSCPGALGTQSTPARPAKKPMLWPLPLVGKGGTTAHTQLGHAHVQGSQVYAM